MSGTEEIHSIASKSLMNGWLVRLDKRHLLRWDRLTKRGEKAAK